MIKNEYVLRSPSHFFYFFLLRIIIYKSKTIKFLSQREIIITSLFQKVLNVSKGNFKIDIKAFSGRLEILKNIISA